jgi:glycosyltransferase involved in cell wall biosynthesis
MRIAIDATPTLVRSAGVKNYIHHWVRHLRERARGSEIRLFPFLRDLGELNHEASPRGTAATVSRLAFVHALRIFGPALLDQALGDADVFHASNLIRAVPRHAKLTATLHDLTSWLMPDRNTRGSCEADYRFAERILSRADGLIAVSENTRQDAIRLLGIAPEKITTIHSGVAPEYFDAAPRRRDRPYLLSVGTIEPRKNYDMLLDAWQRVRPDLRKEFDLVIAGPRGWAREETFARVQSEAIYLGYVPEREMPGLFAAATIFLYPSLYEGFGFPVAQALAARVPVITSNTSALPEVARDGAALVDPTSTEAIAAAIERLLDSPAERTKLAGYGRTSAERFRWEKCAEQSLAFFQRVISR